MKTLGIIGGMGPVATYDLALKIVNRTDAAKDQEHIRVLTDCNTDIPDRTAAILYGGADPLPAMTDSARKLVSIGAEVLMMPCNTAHYFYDGVAEAAGVPVLHMPRLTAQRARDLGYGRAGILATKGTIASGIYRKALEELGIEAIDPGEAGQDTLMALIYDKVKAGNMDFSDLAIPELLTEMKEKGAEVLLLACTELPIAFEKIDAGMPTLDPTLILAESAVLAAGARLKQA